MASLIWRAATFRFDYRNMVLNLSSQRLSGISFNWATSFSINSSYLPFISWYSLCLFIANTFLASMLYYLIYIVLCICMLAMDLRLAWLSIMVAFYLLLIGLSLALVRLARMFTDLCLVWRAVTFTLLFTLDCLLILDGVYWTRDCRRSADPILIMSGGSISWACIV